jgi:hypothetical protein
MHQWDGWIFLVGGCLLIFRALTSKYGINEVDYPISQKEREKYPATPETRLIGVLAGIGGALYGLLRLFWMHGEYASEREE